MRWLVIAAMVMSASAVRAEGKPAAASYVIVIDRALPSDKLAIIDDTLVEALGKADPDHQLAIVTAGASPSVTLGLTAIANKTRIEAKLRAIRFTSKTNLLAGIRTAGSVLARVKSPVRHVLVVTDGDDLLTVGPTLTKLSDAGITVSALGYQSLTRITLGDIAQYGRGKLFLTTDRRALVRSFEDELVPRDQRDRAVVLLIDRSGSMQGPKLEAAKEVARVVAEVLSPDDLIGVVAFDSEASVVVRPQRAANRMRISSEIARIESGGGTNVFPALKEAFDALVGVNTFYKHVIVLSDGESPADGVLELVDQMRAAHIEVSAVGLAGADRGQLSDIAAHGDGHLYMIDDSAALPNLAQTLFDRH